MKERMDVAEFVRSPATAGVRLKSIDTWVEEAYALRQRTRRRFGAVPWQVDRWYTIPREDAIMQGRCDIGERLVGGTEMRLQQRTPQPGDRAAFRRFLTHCDTCPQCTAASVQVVTGPMPDDRSHTARLSQGGA